MITWWTYRFELGTHRTLRFTVDGKPHRIVVWGHGNEDDARLVADTQRIVEVERDFWGGLPYEHYTFFLMLGGRGAGGGLEHRNSTSLLLPRWIFQPAKSYERFLSLTAHEFFHTWNVKRLRGAGLGPFDYTAETYTPLLWAMEGITEYYTDLLLCRAGLLTPERYLERVAEDIEQLQATPGRHLQSLECASFDAWIKYYRPDENSVNTAVSYYLKGALVALALDLTIRERTAGAHSLDDVLRWLFERYPLSGPGVPDDGYQVAVQAVTGLDLSDFFARYIQGVAEVPFAALFKAVGLSMQWSYKLRRPDSEDGAPTLGLRTKQDQGQLKVVSVLRDGPAAQAGLSAEDELVALNGARLSDEASLIERLAELPAGVAAELITFRREQLRRVVVTPAAAPRAAIKLVAAADASAEQRAAQQRWLTGAPGSPAPDTTASS